MERYDVLGVIGAAVRNSVDVVRLQVRAAICTLKGCRGTAALTDLVGAA